MKRPRFIFWSPVKPDDGWRRILQELPRRIAMRGHPVVVFASADYKGHGVHVSDPIFNGFELSGMWVMPAEHAERFPNKRADQTVAAIEPPAEGHLEWDREVSLMTANSYSFFPGIVENDFRGKKYKHENHFCFGHLGEMESREKWLNLNPGDVFLDIGASLGSWTLPAATMGAKVYAFDPGTDAWTLRRHIEINGFGDRVTVLPQFVGKDIGTMRPVEQIPWHSIKAEGPAQPALTTTIDFACTFLGLDRVDFIKIDVDGGEMDALRYGVETIGLFKPRMVVEVHDFLGVDGKEVRDFVQTLGYNCTIEPKEEGFYSHLYCEPKA